MRQIPLTRKIILILILFCIYMIAVLIRVGVWKHFHTQEKQLLPFTGESALLYRYAEMLANGKGIPALDTDAQYPEGLEVSKELSLGYEFIAGAIYRLFFRRIIEFHDFIRYFTAFFFSTGVFALFLIIRELTERGANNRLINLGAVTGATLYAISLPAVIRSTGQEISRENFCLPIIFFHVYFLIRFMKDRKTSDALTAGLLLFLSLSFWEGAQVYFLVLVILMAIKFIFATDDAPYFRGLAIITVSSLLAGITVPYLRNHSFFASPAVAISCALFLTSAIKKVNPSFRQTRKGVLVLIFLAVLFMGLSQKFSGYSKTYSHFTTLLFYKIRFLNNKPYNPDSLPPVVRILWTPALTNPPGEKILFYFSTLLFLAVMPALRTLIRTIRGKSSQPERFLLFNLLIFFLLYVSFERLQVFLIFFICIFIGCWVSFLIRYPRWKASVLLSIVLVCVFIEGVKIPANVATIGRDFDYRNSKDLLRWIEKKTPQDAVILSHFTISPLILTYTKRKIILHPKYESEKMREKINRYILSLFSASEEQFYSFCLQTGAEFFVFPRGTFSTSSRYSWRYMAGVSPYARNSNAYLFEYHPGRFKKFQLIYSNGKYTVYKIYKEEEFLSFKEHLERGTAFFKEYRYQEAISEYNKAIKVYPKSPNVYWKLATAYYLQGKREKARELWDTASFLENSSRE